MLTLLSSLFGFITSFAPEFFNFIKDKRDKAHEIEIMRLQLQASKAGKQQSLDEIEIQNSFKETEMLYKDTVKLSKAANILAASVRPIITYSFFLLYVLAKITMFQVAEYDLWNEEDQILFCAIIGFWFGHRAFNKIKK